MSIPMHNTIHIKLSVHFIEEPAFGLEALVKF